MKSSFTNRGNCCGIHLLCFLLSLLPASSFSQTAASYVFSRSSATFSTISSTGTAIGTSGSGILDDDGRTAAIPIGFNFSFCGTTYSTCSGNSNMVLSLQSTATAGCCPASPAAILGAGWLMPFWTNADGRTGSGGTPRAYYQTTGSAGSRIFTIEWSDFSVYNQVADHINLQVKLYEATNGIQFCYGSFSASQGGIVGIANSASDLRTLPNVTATAADSLFNTIASLPANGTILTFTPPCPTNAATPSSQSICSGSSITGIVPASNATNTTFTWTRDNTTIVTGMAASGSGAMNGSLVNTLNVPVTVTFTISPNYSAISATCIAVPFTASVIVKPIPRVNTVPAQVACNYSGSTPINFSSLVSGTTFAWTNNNTAIGLAASGAGNVPSFTALNPGSVIASSRILVTPTANGCVGAADSFTISVKPAPIITPILNESIYNGAMKSSYIFNSSLAGTTYTWTNNTPGIGLPASDTGNIPAFIAVNAGSTPVTATFTVTPVNTNSSFCPGNSTRFYLIVQPTPVMPQPGNLTVCNGAAMPAVTFTGPNANTAYHWINNNPSIGLPASGTGDIPSFKAVDTGSLPATAFVSVTPTAPASFAYLATSTNLIRLNLETNQIVDSLPLPCYLAIGTAVSPDGTKMYVGCYSPNLVAVINTVTNKIVSKIPQTWFAGGIAVHPDGNKVYVANTYAFTVSVIDANSNTVVATIPVGNDPRGIVVSPDGSKVYVANSYSNSISVINTTTNSVISTIVTGSPFGIVMSLDGRKLFVSNSNSNTVSVINTATNAITTTINVGSNPAGIELSPDGSKVYVANNGSYNMSIINANTNTLISTNYLGGASPLAVSVSPDGNEVFFTTNSGPISLFLYNTVLNKVASFYFGSYLSGLGNFISGSASPCAGIPKTFTLTVRPSPKLTTIDPAPICSNSLTNINLNFNTAVSSYTYTAIDSAGVATGYSSGTANPIVQGLTNTSDFGTRVDYTVSMVGTASSGSCVGSGVVHQIVKPLPRLINIDDETICSGSRWVYFPIYSIALDSLVYSRVNLSGALFPRSASNIHLAPPPFIIDDSLSLGTKMTIDTMVYIFNLYPQNGCKARPQYKSLTVQPTPVKPEIITKPDLICEKAQFANFGATRAPSPDELFEWSADNGAQVYQLDSLNRRYALISFPNPGPTHISLTSTFAISNCKSADSNISIEVGESTTTDPNVVYFSGNLVCLNPEQNTTAYQWGYDDQLSLDSSILNGETFQTLQVSAADLLLPRSYWVIATIRGCPRKSYYNTPFALSGPSLLGAEAPVRVYPNPAKQLVNIEFLKDYRQGIQGRMSDVTGRVVRSLELRDRKNVVNIEDLAHGYYIFSCYQNGMRLANFRIIKN